MAHVQSAQKASTPLSTDTLQLTGVVAGRTLIVAMRLSSGSDPLSSFTDSNGTPTPVYNQLSPTASIRTYLYKIENCAAGTHTFTATWGSNQTWRWIAAEYSEAEIDTLDIAAFASNTAITGPAVTSTVPNDTLVGIISVDSTTSIDPNHGETERQEVNQGLQLEDLALGAIASSAPQWLLGAARAGVAITLVMKSSQSNAPRARFQEMLRNA